MALTRYICITIGKYLGERVGWTATDALRDEFVRHCLKLDMSFHKARTPGELIERLDGDINLLTNFFSQFVVGIVFNTLLLVGIVLALFMEDWRIGLGMMFFTILAVVVLIALNQKGIKNWAAARQANASFYGFLGERLSGTEDIRSCGANDFVLKRFYEALRGWLPKFIKADMSHFYLWIGSLLVFGIGMALVLATGALLYRAGTVSLGTVFLIFSYTTLLERPISQIRRQMQDLQRAAAAIDRVGKIFAIKSNLRGPGMGMSDRHEPGSQAELC
ncbi:MAG TPA: ABC transporter ATP-binding protein, partial [Firmicutes bacterium]|nr:ABC transporter ATP-binding protein [Bacillota bacterium]